MDESKIKQAEDKIRALINDISVMNEEEIEGATKRIEDDAASQLKGRLQEIASLIGSE